MVAQLDQATRVRLAYMRREVSNSLRLPVNNSTLLRLAVARFVREFERTTEQGEGSIEWNVLARDVARANAGDSLPVGEAFALESDRPLSALISDQNKRELARVRGGQQVSP
jgi:hypothetical protein